MLGFVRRTVAVAAIAAVAFLSTTVPAEAATPVPGRFCKSVDIGKKVTTPKYGVVVCMKAGDRARWKQR